MCIYIYILYTMIFLPYFYTTLTTLQILQLNRFTNQLIGARVHLMEHSWRGSVRMKHLPLLPTFLTDKSATNFGISVTIGQWILFWDLFRTHVSTTFPVFLVHGPPSLPLFGGIRWNQPGRGPALKDGASSKTVTGCSLEAETLGLLGRGGFHLSSRLPQPRGAPPFDSHGPAKSEEKPKGVLSEHKTILFDIWFVSIYLLMQKIYLKTLHESHEPTFAWYRYSEHRMNTGLFVSIYLPNKGCKCRMCSSACVCKFDVATAPWSRATAAVTVAWPSIPRLQENCWWKHSFQHHQLATGDCVQRYVNLIQSLTRQTQAQLERL